MLRSRLLEYRQSADGRIVPRWLTARDELWLRELIAEATAVVGKCALEAEERILERVAPVARRFGASRLTVAGAWAVERKRWTTGVAAPIAPRKIRRHLFELAAERSSEEAIALTAAELGVEAAEIERCLFADRMRERLLMGPKEGPSATHEIVDRYNLALVQTLLMLATGLTATVTAHVSRVVRAAKLLGLMAVFEGDDDGCARMTLSGPLALFHDRVKYGNALARWFPSLVASGAWTLSARVRLRGESRRLDLDATSPLPRTLAMPRCHDSRLEARFDADLRTSGTGWRIEREAAVVRMPAKTTSAEASGGRRRLFFPDFALTSEKGMVLVEIVGWWTPAYLAHKAMLLEALSAFAVPAVICVDERHARGTVFTKDPRVVTFKERIDVPKVLAACERALDSSIAAGGSDDLDRARREHPLSLRLVEPNQDDVAHR